MKAELPRSQPEKGHWWRSALVPLSGFLIALLLMLGISWKRWAHPIVDYGRELYVAWRLSAGDRLYVDIEQAYSPLSPYLNLLWFKLLGVSYASLAIGNGFVLAGTLAVLYATLRRFSSRLAAGTAMIVSIVCFGLGKYADSGDFGYLTPYAHELTHGVFFGLCSLLALDRYARTRARSAITAVGFLTGLVFLTKFEVLLAVVAAVLAVVPLCRRDHGRLRLYLDLVAAVAAFLAPVAATWLALASYLSANDAWKAVLGVYPLLFQSQPARAAFDRATFGVDNLGGFAFNAASWAALYLLSTLPVAMLRERRHTRVETLIPITLPLLLLALTRSTLRIDRSLFPLPLTLAGASAVMVLGLARSRPEGRSSRLGELGLAVFSTVLLARVFFNPSLRHYALVLAMPGSALATSWIFDRVPQYIAHKGLNPRPFMVSLWSLLLGWLMLHVAESSRMYGPRRFDVASGPDQFKGSRLGVDVDSAVKEISARLKPAETLLVLPEGAMVNYLARRRSPLRHVNFHPSYIDYYGEDSIVSELSDHPPDMVLAWSRQTFSQRVLGCPVFGRDCAVKLGRWIDDNYRAVLVARHGERRMYTLLRRAALVGSSGPVVLEVPSPESSRPPF